MGKWVSHQRTTCNRKDRVAQLNRLGFCWNGTQLTTRKRQLLDTTSTTTTTTATSTFGGTGGSDDDDDARGNKSSSVQKETTVDNDNSQTMLLVTEQTGQSSLNVATSYAPTDHHTSSTKKAKRTGDV